MKVAADILAIDDDEESVEGFISECDLLGYSVVMVQSVAAAARRLKKEKFRLLVVDLRMPITESGPVQDNGGVQLILKLREGAYGSLNQDVPYVMVSAQAFRLDRVEARLSQQDLAGLLAGRLGKLMKIDDPRPTLKKIVEVLGQPSGTS